MEEKQITPVFSGNVQGSYTDQITKKIVWGCCFVGFMYISQGRRVLGSNPKVCSWLTQTYRLYLKGDILYHQV